ncbi:MAG: gas vesicle protein GvpN [Chloroflexi bacterium]|nr:gas vesicle protein GvpN [Chloroflexota bacterium]
MRRAEATTVLAARPRAGFVETAYITSLADRALAYITAGYPVHLRGPSGSGKTTLALHLAHRIGQPFILICGDDEFGSSDLVGGQHGFFRRKVIDNFVHSVLKTEEDVSQRWVDNRLTTACREGFTLVYDEFTRSRPEANNVLLSVLEEKILLLPASANGNSYLKVHPNFVAIFTSNPDEYAGVHKTQDALCDRMVTIDLEHFDRETELAIAQAQSGLPLADAAAIVDLVRACRAARVPEFCPSVRSCVMIAKVLALHEAPAVAGNATFEQVCLDVLAADGARPGTARAKAPRRRDIVLELIRQRCPSVRNVGTPAAADGTATLAG